MPRYRGESNAYDIPNNIIYRGDLLYGWDVGDTLTGWTLGGTTVPTLALDGRINLYDATNLADQMSWALIQIPNTLGGMAAILHAKVIKMNDDTSTDNIAFALQLGPGTGVLGVPNGMTYWVDSGVPRSNLLWRNLGAAGTTLNIALNPTVGQEYDVSIVLTDKDVLVLIDNVKQSSLPISTLGNASQPQHPAIAWRTLNKQILLFTKHDAGQVSHYRVRDIRVSRLVGISNM